MIPATDTIDRQARQEPQAEALYREILPAVVFTMQSLDTLVCHGKRSAAARMGPGEGFDRAPALLPDRFGSDCAGRYAREPGALA